MKVHKALPPHILRVDPIGDPDEEAGVAIPSEGRRAYVNLGWVIQTSDVMNEGLSPGDLVVFQPWAERREPKRPYAHWRYDHHYMVLHEDDCIMVLEDW